MQLSRIWPSVLLISIWLVAAGCTAGGSNDAALPLGGAAANAQQPAADAEFALAAPAELPIAVQARQASFVPEDLIRTGNAYEPGLPNQNVAQQPGQAAFSASWAGGLDGAAYCLYSLYVEGFNLDPKFYYGWATAPDPLGSAWIGLANWSDNRWDWWQCGSQGYFDLGSIADYDHPLSHALVAAVVVAGTGSSELNFLRIGPTAIVPALVATPSTGLPPLQVSFNASGSINELGSITGYSWDFDGDLVEDLQGPEPTAMHTYTETGSYPATVTVHNSLGESAKATVDIKVTGAWSHTWGGPDYERINGIAVTSDAIYAAGPTHSYTNSPGDAGLLLKYGGDGSFEWARAWSGTAGETYFGVAAAGNDVFTCGQTDSFGAGDSDVLVQRWDSFGNLVWSRTWGKTSFEAAYGIGLRNGVIYVCGFTESMYDPTGDALLIAYDYDGNVIWAKVFGEGSFLDSASCLVTTTEFISGDVRIHVAGNTDNYMGTNSKLVYSVFNDEGVELIRQSWNPGLDAYSTALWIGGTLSDERYVVGRMTDLIFTTGLLVEIDAVPFAVNWSSAGANTSAQGLVKLGNSIYVASNLTILGGDSGGLLCQFSELGAFEGCQIWSDTDAYEVFHAMAPFTGGGFVLAGQADSPAGTWSAQSISVSPQSVLWDDRTPLFLDTAPLNPVTGSPSLEPEDITDATLDEHVEGDYHEAYLSLVVP